MGAVAKAWGLRVWGPSRPRRAVRIVACGARRALSGKAISADLRQSRPISTCWGRQPRRGVQPLAHGQGVEVRLHHTLVIAGPSTETINPNAEIRIPIFPQVRDLAVLLVCQRCGTSFESLFGIGTYLASFMRML